MLIKKNQFAAVTNQLTCILIYFIIEKIFFSIFLLSYSEFHADSESVTLSVTTSIFKDLKRYMSFKLDQYPSQIQRNVKKRCTKLNSKQIFFTKSIETFSKVLK